MSLLPERLGLSPAGVGVGEAVISPEGEDSVQFVLIGQGDHVEQNRIAEEIVRRWNGWREPAVGDLFDGAKP